MSPLCLYIHTCIYIKTARLAKSISELFIHFQIHWVRDMNRDIFTAYLHFRIENMVKAEKLIKTGMPLK